MNYPLLIRIILQFGELRFSALECAFFSKVAGLGEASTREYQAQHTTPACPFLCPSVGLYVVTCPLVHPMATAILRILRFCDR